MPQVFGIACARALAEVGIAEHAVFKSSLETQKHLRLDYSAESPSLLGNVYLGLYRHR
jgi:hypothetical protein